MSISKEDILFKTNNGLDVFKHFLGSRFIKVGSPFNSPFYNDTKASCHIYRDKKSGEYKFHDFGDGEYHGDCFFFVSKMYNLDYLHKEDFIQVLNIINAELAIGLDTRNEQINKLRMESKGELKRASELTSPFDNWETADRNSSFQLKPFSAKELEYWQQYGITENELIRYSVVSILSFEGVGKTGKKYKLTSTESEPIFGYQDKKFTKLYLPFSKLRFLYVGKKTENYCFGFEQLPVKGDIVFITGGEKDVLSLAAHGFYAISMNSETAHIPKNLIRSLSFRFKHTTLLYDTDETGKKSMLRLAQEHKAFHLSYLILPLSGKKGEKDISDFFAKGYTADHLKMLFLEMIEKLYDESLSILKSCQVDFRYPPAMPEPLIAINEVTVGAPGNIMCIAGSEGSGKSNYLGSLISGAIKAENAKIDTLGTFVRENIHQRAVLFYDTEQSEYQLFKNLKIIVKRSQQKFMPEWFKAYGLVGISRSERMKMILESMDKFYYEFGGIQMVVIDGIADLISSVNDEESSVQLIEELFRLAAIYNTVIICVLHIAPSAMKLRGHLGSEVQRKAAGILLIEKDDENQTSTLKALKVRDGSPLDVPIVEFGWSKEESRHVFVGFKSKEAAHERKIRELTEIAHDIFRFDTLLKPNDLTEKVMDALSVKDRMARNHIKFMIDYNIIEHSTQYPSMYRLKIT